LTHCFQSEIDEILQSKFMVGLSLT
jgi:hypothetical protein